MSTEAATRAQIRAALTNSTGLSAPTVEPDVYVRESAALCPCGARREQVVLYVQRRMALPLLEDTDEKAVFAIEQSNKYNKLEVYFANEQVVSHKLIKDGSKQE